MRVERRCSFCNKSEHDVAKLVAGPSVYICDSCVRIATRIIEHSSIGPSRLGFGERVRKFFIRFLSTFHRTDAVA